MSFFFFSGVLIHFLVIFYCGKRVSKWHILTFTSIFPHRRSPFYRYFSCKFTVFAISFSSQLKQLKQLTRTRKWISKWKRKWNFFSFSFSVNPVSCFRAFRCVYCLSICPALLPRRLVCWASFAHFPSRSHSLFLVRSFVSSSRSRIFAIGLKIETAHKHNGKNHSFSHRLLSVFRSSCDSTSTTYVFSPESSHVSEIALPFGRLVFAVKRRNFFAFFEANKNVEEVA